MGLIPDFSIETWTLIVFLVTLVTVYGYAPYGFFKKLGIRGPKPLPFIGTFLEYKKGIHIFDTDCFQKYGRIWGIYDGRQPVLAIMDTGMIKTILVKECYSVFTNRRDFGLNGPLRDAVSITEDEEWKRIRSVLSPSFTSGRLKEMYDIIMHHSGNLIKSLQKKVEAGEVIEVKEVFGPYSMDVVTSTAFSVDIDSINHPSDPFVTNIKKMVKFNFLSPLLVALVLFPFLGPLFDKLDLTLFPAGVLEFFYNFLKKVKSDRNKKEHKNRVDFMQLMVDAQISQDNNEELSSIKKGLTDHEILSQAMIFIFAGYETSSSTMGFFAYNLATNPEIQKKLQEEIDETFPGKVRPSYDALMQMEYLDMVLNESSRLYPIANRLERMTKSSVEVNGVSIPKGTTVMVPVYTLQRDPTLWPDPETFNPERRFKDRSCCVHLTDRSEYRSGHHWQLCRLRLVKNAKDLYKDGLIYVGQAPSQKKQKVMELTLTKSSGGETHLNVFCRFSKENKDNIDPYAFLPFGAGPRNCIGMRFALLMMKLALVEILQNFSFSTCKETDIPMELSPDAFTTPKNPIKLKLELRKNAA